MSRIVRKPILSTKKIKKVDKGIVKNLDIKEASRDVLRVLARLVYVTSQEKLGPSSLNKMPMFKHLPISTLELWQRTDNWVVERKAYLQRIELALTKQMQDEHVKSVIEHLRELDDLSNLILNKVHNGEVYPKTLEGLITAWERISRLRNDIRDKVALMLEPEIKDVTNKMNLLPQRQIDPNIVRKVAVELIKAQQQRDKNAE